MDDARRLRADGLAAEPALTGGTGAAPNDERRVASDPADEVDHTVWDEPTLVAHREAREPPEDQLTYRRWLQSGIERTTWSRSWLVTVGLVLAAGPFGVIGAIAAGNGGQETSLVGLLAVTVLAPVTEEITKLAGALWVVEKRPYWFKSMAQLLLCAAAGGLAFAAIENVLYIYVYAPASGDAFRVWRWTVCTSLHFVCSMTAGWGLIRIWDQAIRTHSRPELAHGMPLFALAMVTHGSYNFAVTLAEVFGWLSFG